MSVYSRRFFSALIVLVISLLYIFNSFASTAGSATPSDATQVKDKQFDIAISSNATPLDDFMESDGFDMLDVPVLMSSGDLPSVSNTVDFSSVQLTMYYYDMSNNVKSVHASFNGSGYASIARPSDYARLSFVRFRLYRNSLPPSGIYNVSVNFASNTGVTYTGANIYSLKKTDNASDASSYVSVGFTQSSGDFYISKVVDLGNVYELSFDMRSNDLVPPYGGYVKINFTKTTAQPDYTTAGGSYTSDNATHDIANNTAQQVEQGDTIIELIKNTIQTISSQLTAFWNQLAGEFTNLYNKMTQQHSEQLQADRDNTDDIIAADDANTNKVTTAIESHGNFIIEGLKKLFIPSDEYFKAYFDDLYSWFSERFGFLSFPIDLLLEVIDIFVNSSQTDCVLVLPSFSIMDNLLWPEMSFNLTEFLDTNFSFVVVAIKTVTSIYLVMAFVQLCEEKWNEVMMN